MLFFTSLLQFLVESKDLFACSDTLCTSYWISDGYCDELCMIEGCNFDSGFSGNTKYDSFLFSDCFWDCSCDKEMLTNNKCDPECDNYYCGWDLGDCGSCYSGCFESDLIGSECKENCNEINCMHNNNNCGWCNEGCYFEDLQSDSCKEECLYGYCLYFYPNPCAESLCSEGCYEIMKGDFTCDYECYNYECDYDEEDCDCASNCWDTSQECYSDDYLTDYCDNKDCRYKDGKCGDCASGCFENNLGDGICQDKCNNEDCYYDNGDCGCYPGCSFIYDSSISNFSQIGSSEECSVNCLVPECHFAIDFCGDKDTVKMGVLNYVVQQDSSVFLNLDSCDCSSESIEGYLNGSSFCDSGSECSGEECLFCMGMANAEFSECVRNSFKKCLVCVSTMVDGICYENLNECPKGYEVKKGLSNMFNNTLWCLREAVHYSTSNYKEVFVNDNSDAEGSVIDNDYYSSLYAALINVYASYTKIYILSKEIYFYKDESTSIFVSDMYDPLNSNSKLLTQELWIIGSYAENEKSKVYWWDNLKLTPQSKKFYLINLEFIGIYLLDDCYSEFCTYCPNLSMVQDYYFNDRNDFIDKSSIYANYSTNCEDYSSVNVFDFSNEVYIENVDFNGFRYQYNSFIRSSGVLRLANVNFYKMQAKVAGSVIMLYCTSDCIETSFSYDKGIVMDIGAGYDDTANVATGSFLLSSRFGFIAISNVEFSYNFMLINQLNMNNSFLIYSLNHLGTISITGCRFYNNYANFLIYVDVSELIYTDYRPKTGISLSYSQQHFYMNNTEISNTYCSEGIFYYLMKRKLHNINISNLVVNNSVIGPEGILSIINQGTIKDSDINGETIKKAINGDSLKIHLPLASLNLETITIENSNTGLSSIMIVKHPTVNLKYIRISNIKDGSISNVESIIQSFKNSNPSRYLSNIDAKNELPDLNCSEMISISGSVNLKLDSITIFRIYCQTKSVTSGLFLEKISGSTEINTLTLFDMEASVASGIALTIKDSKSITINSLSIQNISNLYDSILLFDSCVSIIIDTVEIYNTSTVYSGSFIVSNTNTFSLTAFEFKNLSSQYSNGGCLNLLTGASGSSYVIKSGFYTECKAFNAKGGAIYLDSISTKSETVVLINDIEIKNCLATEGSALYLSRTVNLGNSGSINRVLISNCLCEEGGIIVDLHSFGTLKFDQLKMNNNEGLYAGIFGFYSSNTSALQVSDSIFVDSNSKNPLFCFRALVLGELVYLKNVTMRFVNGTGISIFNLKMAVNGLFMNYVNQPLLIESYSELNATDLEIRGSILNSVYLKSRSVLVCVNCEFISNEDSVLDSGDFCYFTMINTSISSNSPKSEYLILISSGLKVSSSIINSNVSSNILNSGNLIYLFSSEILIKDCLFISNRGLSSAIQGIYILKSVLNILNSRFQFETFVDSGAFIYAVTKSKILAKNSYFENSLSGFGNFFCSDVEIEIINCTFSGNKGGDIFITLSNLRMVETIFQKSVLTGQNSGVVVLNNNNFTKIERSKFTSVSSLKNIAQVAYLYDEVSKQLDVKYCDFIGSSQDILGLYSKQSTSITIEGSKFSEFSTVSYSALTVVSTSEGCNLSLKTSKLTKNKSQKNGGGAYLQNCNSSIEDTEISFNEAKESGGGLYFTSPTCDNCGLFITGNSKMFNNSCTANGGAIKWEDFKPYIQKRELIFNNSAEYGLDLASIPARLGVPHFRRLSDLILGTFQDVPPGKKYTNPGELWIYDAHDQLVTTENSIQITLSINDTKSSESSVSGSTVFRAQNGIINVTNFILSGDPGSEMYLKLNSDGLTNRVVRNDDTVYTDTVYIHVQFRNCTNGEQIQTTACVDCSAGKYTLKASEDCLSCPDGAVCNGGYKIIIENGYWRSSLESDVIYTCEVFEACLKGNETNELGECGAGYSGVLCQSCIVGYSKNSSGQCAKCPNQLSNIIILFTLCVVIVFVSAILVKTTLASAFEPKALHSIYIKIFTNYLQLVFIVTQFNLEWPSYIIELFKIQKTAATVSDQIFSVDCYFAQRSSNSSSDGYYIKLCIVTGIPIFIITISYLYWMGHGYIVKSYSGLKREVYTTMIVIFFLVYPNIVKLLFSNFSCVPIDKMESYLKENTEIECWDSTHIKYSLIVAVPGIILWALGIPTLLLVLMAKYKRRLHLDKFRVIFGFFFNGYKLRKFYWELIIMYRKILLITISVFMASEAIILQALNVIVVLIASLYLQYSNRPYNSTELNNMEMQALCIAAITIYSGLYYLSKSIGEVIKVILFIAIVLGNSYFLVYWVFYMIRALIDMVVKIFPQLKAKFKRGDAFDEEFYQKEIVQQGVYFNPLEGKKAYTFLEIEEKKHEKMKFKTMEDAFEAVAKKDIKKIYKKNGWKLENK